jgi:hypothetical protein
VADAEVDAASLASGASVDEEMRAAAESAVRVRLTARRARVLSRCSPLTPHRRPRRRRARRRRARMRRRRRRRRRRARRGRARRRRRRSWVARRSSGATPFAY